jgi:formylmethanofuran dehydrogenase subunit E
MRRSTWTWVMLLMVGCAAPAERGHDHDGHGHAHGPHDAMLSAVARVHGGAGPFAVAGYRMGQRALKELGRTRGDFALEVVHTCPQKVQWSCIADGLQAATGASPGKLNLTLAFVPENGGTESRVRDRESGKTIVLGLTDAFRAAYLDTPMEKLGEAGERVAALPDDDIFWVKVQ